MAATLFNVQPSALRGGMAFGRFFGPNFLPMLARLTLPYASAAASKPDDSAGRSNMSIDFDVHVQNIEDISSTNVPSPPWAGLEDNRRHRCTISAFVNNVANVVLNQ
ncbi:hypothetical protein MSAN_02111300 [Mycena sanguinolenta]|uniref:Uncharacterized protein n=1 Tax=Mycena sanguinolenta TaxID=230812 RepID=A0A8H6XI72_9AGAR|nr:hypothetical protein MSAN_02111300 [Mycena sanguinolenta]